MNNTMKLEQQVTSLELSKKLKELGVKQDSLFYWDWTVGPGVVFGVEKTAWKLNNKDVYKNTFCSALTVAELGEMLIDGCGTGRSVLTSDKKYQGMFRGQKFEDDNEANCRAKMLIWLIEKGYITQ